MSEENGAIDEHKSNELDEVTEMVVVEGAEITVSDQDSYDAAAKFCERIKKRIRDVEEFFAPLKRKANEAHKAITSEERNKLAPLKEVFNNVESVRSEWFKEEERKVREAKEMQREVEAEKERVEQLKKAQEEEALANAEEAGELGELPEKKEPEPEPEPKPAPTPAPVAPRASSGTKMRREWKGRVTDMTALIKSIAEGKAPEDIILKLDQKAIDRFAKKIKKTVEVPGMEAYEDVKSAYGG